MMSSAPSSAFRHPPRVAAAFSAGMTIVSDVDLAAFRAAGEKAYEKLNLAEARKQVYKELGR